MLLTYPNVTKCQARFVKVIFMVLLILYLCHNVDDITGYLLNVNHSPQRLSSSLLPRLINSQEYDDLMDLMGSFLEHCRRAEITVVMSFGSLLGSYMFHDVVPWDDDMDMWIPQTDLPKLKRYFRDAVVPWDDDMDMWIPQTDLPKLKRYFRDAAIWETHGISSWRQPLREFDLDVLKTFPENAEDSDFYRASYNDMGTKAKHVLKYYKMTSINPGGCRWKWPFVDVVTYDENSTHVWNDESHDIMYIPKDRFYPLSDRPLGKLWIKAPADTGYVLRSRYSNFSCKSNRWIHKVERAAQQQATLPCHLLWDVYPQVWSESRGPDWERETLRLGNKTIHSYDIRTRVKLDKSSKRPYDF